MNKKPKNKRGILLKDLTETDLLVACDHWEEFGTPLGDWVKGAWKHHGNHLAGYGIPLACYLRWAKDYQINCLIKRLPHAHILMPVTSNRIPEDKIIRDEYFRRCRQVTAFPIKAIVHLFNFLNVQKSDRYWRPLGHGTYTVTPYVKKLLKLPDSNC